MGRSRSILERQESIIEACTQRWRYSHRRQALLRLTAPDASFGTQEITLTSVGGNAWETHGSEFSLAGDWSVTAIVRKVGEFQWQATGTASIAATAASSTAPGEPWHFGKSAIFGLLLLLIGSACAGWAITAKRGASRREAGGIAIATLVAGLLLILQARLPDRRRPPQRPPTPQPSHADRRSISSNASPAMASPAKATARKPRI